MLASEQWLARLLREQRHRFGPLRFHECASAAELCARQIGARGPCTTLSTACSAGALAIAAAAELIEQDEADVVLAGASDSLCRLTLHGFGSLLLLDPNGCRPFDATRAGISLGEGAAVLVLEAESVARRRGAQLLAALSGWGASCDAYHATAPQPDGDVTGEHWTKTSPETKKAYLIGIANLLQVETAYFGANPPTDAQSFVPRMVKGLRGQTLDTVRDALDLWYGSNSAQLQRPSSRQSGSTSSCRV